MGKLVQLRSNSPGFPDIATPGFGLIYFGQRTASSENIHPPDVSSTVFNCLFTIIHPSTPGRLSLFV